MKTEVQQQEKEIAQREAGMERQRAERLAAKLRKLGLDPEQI